MFSERERERECERYREFETDIHPTNTDKGEHIQNMTFRMLCRKIVSNILAKTNGQSHWNLIWVIREFLV